MTKQFNRISFYLSLFILVFSIHIVYSITFQTWNIAPPSYVLWILTIIALVLGIKGFKYGGNRLARVRSWFTVIISVILSIPLFMGTIRFLFFSEELITSTHSPDSKYTIHLYLTNGGATTAYGVNGELDGPLWFTKRIYKDYRIDQAEIEWINNHTVSINQHILDLAKGETFSFTQENK